MWHCSVSISEIHYSCINAINCTGKNMSDGLLYALGQADANMYICSDDLRPSENPVYYLFIWFLCCSHFCAIADIILERTVNVLTSICIVLTFYVCSFIYQKMQKTSPKDRKDDERRPQSSIKPQNDGQKMAKLVLSNNKAHACAAHIYRSMQNQRNIFQQCTNLHLSKRTNE